MTNVKSKGTSAEGAGCPPKYIKLKQWIEGRILAANGGKVQFKTELKTILTEQYPCLFNEVSLPTIKHGTKTFSIKKLFNAVGVAYTRPCLQCGEPTGFSSDYSIPREFCSNRCSSLNSRTQGKLRGTNVSRRGVTNPSYCPKVKEKRVTTCYQNSGFTHQMKDPAVREQSQQSCLLTTGFKFAMQSPELFSQAKRSGFSVKEFTDKKGYVHYCRGYEPIVLGVLDKSKKVAKFTTVEGSGLLPDQVYRQYEADKKTGVRSLKTHVYHPDIGVLLKSGVRLIIEVKSDYHLYGDQRKARMNRAKYKRSVRFCNEQTTRTEFWLALVVEGNILWIRDGLFKIPRELGTRRT